MTLLILLPTVIPVACWLAWELIEAHDGCLRRRLHTIERRSTVPPDRRSLSASSPFLSPGERRARGVGYTAGAAGWGRT